MVGLPGDPEPPSTFPTEPLVPDLPANKEAQEQGHAAVKPDSVSPSRSLVVTQNLGFDKGLTPWTVGIEGGSQNGMGSVTSGSAVLKEGDSFLVGLQRSFPIQSAEAQD